MNVFVARHVLYEAVDEDDGTARRTRGGLVSAGVKGQGLGAGEPGFGEVGHLVVDDKGRGSNADLFPQDTFRLFSWCH